MKPLYKQLLTTSALLVAFCGLTSFNPLSHLYNGEKGSTSLASLDLQIANAINAASIAATTSERNRNNPPNIKAACKDQNKLLQMTPQEKKECLSSEGKALKDSNANALNEKKTDLEGHACIDCLNHAADAKAIKTSEQQTSNDVEVANKKDHKRRGKICNERSFNKNISCFSDKFDALDPNSDTDADLYSKLQSQFLDFVENSAKDDQVSPQTFRKKVIRVASLTGDRDFIKEVKSLAEEGFQYKAITENSDRAQKQLTLLANRADQIQQQMNALGCSQNIVSINNPMMQNNFNGMNNNIMMTPQSFACSQLQMTQAQATFQLESALSNIKSSYRSTYFIGKHDDFAQDLKSQLAEDYESIISDYSGFIKDKGLLSLDTVSNISNINNQTTKFNISTMPGWVRVNPTGVVTNPAANLNGFRPAYSVNNLPPAMGTTNPNSFRAASNRP